MLAEYAILPPTLVLQKSGNISFTAASGLAANRCTALQFCDISGMKKGDKILVIATSGGPGFLIVQFARAVVGSEKIIVGTYSASNTDLFKGLGADEVIEYRSHLELPEYIALHRSLRPFNIIIGIAGSEDLCNEIQEYLNPGGIFLQWAG
ncbi:uncharacterized protein A1O5_04317 [Cladophialophora psammophila CBS 110553]|uniref:Alcohol dehydrogenase-like C-terminal domain-containing protein n=1 Tax=Cladophialophora psammophila CBS 110553 TaxID=1182543 RepID=W9WY63_9EURO|nr:uncharacterized protein A1O5_04317 [Cladophialophora psammophila CBS 110553]EXJ73167.1 hypothetical protein A1O5_04317 [Cladophialophora psammophila CBS 110553]